MVLGSAKNGFENFYNVCSCCVLYIKFSRYFSYNSKNRVLSPLAREGNSVKNLFCFFFKVVVRYVCPFLKPCFSLVLFIL